MEKTIVSQRQSGIELLRSISMALVVLTHADFWALGFPTASFCATDMAKAAFQYYVEFFSMICVNCFIFISGWFSLKPTVKGLCKLLFQIYFYNLLIFLISAIVGNVNVDVTQFCSHLNVFVHWFIPAYLGLYLLSPIFNTFIETVDKKTASTIVLLFVALDVFLGWFEDYLLFNGGYSMLHFFVIYLMARYIRVHGGRFFAMSRKWDMMIFWAIALAIPSLIVLSYYVAPAVWNCSSVMFRYNNPLVLVMTVYFCLYFTKLKFRSSLVNFVGASSFAVYLIHTDTLVRQWCIEDFCKGVFFSHSLAVFIGALVFLIVSLFAIAVIVDPLRQRLWQRCQSRIFK